jgi:putative flippase GtrA
MSLPATATSVRDAAQKLAGGAWANGEHKLFTRYVLVSGAFGLPASIVQLQAMVWVYEAWFGDIDRIMLNVLWVFNFEFSLVRNFLLHCAFTWRTNPTRKRLAHVHVAAGGAFVIDFIAFNVVLLFTDIILIAQVFGASSGFLCNFLYNRFRTFGAPSRANEEREPVPGGIV